MRSFLLWSAVVSAVLNFVQPLEGKCTPRQPTPQEVALIPCSAGDVSCEVWRQFRGAHPFPYQTIAVSTQPNNEVIVIVSEPPPVGPPKDVAALAAAVFDDASPAVERVRFPIGHDGWLEDVVIRARSDAGSTVPVATADGGVAQLPHRLANRLQYLHEVLFGSAEEWYVDVIDPNGSVKRPKLTDLKVTGSDLQAAVADPTRKWRSLGLPEAVGVAWTQVMKSRTVTNFVDDAAKAVALVIPKDTDIDSMRGEFRKFAVTTDYIVGALRPKSGGVVIFGRDRVIPLDVLPPLRFETVASLGSTLGQPLAQSYERQRVLAGKIRSGERAEWDWAPIYLSPQLQDSELGTLLNLADQQLKSWSEHGDVRYARFLYPDPEAFPFGERPASDWFTEETLTTSLTFNWNTTAFATAVDLTPGRVVSASSTTALPVSYIPSMENEPEFIAKLRRLINIDSETRTKEGSNTGTRYFASLGDPILARVVQNVFLYQILGETKPFKKTPTPASNDTKRSTIVTKILIGETTRWLNEAIAPGSNANAELVSLIQASGMAVPKLAELLAAPDLNTRAILRAEEAWDLNARALKQLYDEGAPKEAELNDLSEKSTAEFKSKCKDLHGKITDVMNDGRPAIKCSYETPMGNPATFPTSYDDRIAALEAELDVIMNDINEAKNALKKAEKTLERLAKERATAEKVADDLRARASYADDLDRVLAHVVQATSDTASSAAIQTPSVVLSCNTIDQDSVGGHNIDAIPWLAKQGSSKAAPAIRAAAERPTLILPQDQLGRSAEIARDVVEGGAPPKVPIDRPLSEALGVSPEPKRGSFLEQLRERTKPPDEDYAALQARASGCNCDVYVERGASDTALIVSLGPPPKSQAVFGSSGLVEKLAEQKASSRVLFNGFAKEQVNSLAHNAQRVAADAKRNAPGFLEDPIKRAKDLFRNAVETSVSVLRLPSKRGKQAITTFAGSPNAGSSPIGMLSQKPSWSQATVVRGGSEPARPLFEVVLAGKADSDLGNIAVHVVGERAPSAAEHTAKARTMLSSLPKNEQAVGDVVNRLWDQLARDPAVEEVEFFLKDVATSRVVRLHPTRESRTVEEVRIGE